jgi:hypothetical protein
VQESRQLERVRAASTAPNRRLIGDVTQSPQAAEQEAQTNKEQGETQQKCK